MCNLPDKTNTCTHACTNSCAVPQIALLQSMLSVPPWCFFPLTLQYLSTAYAHLGARECLLNEWVHFYGACNA